MDVRIELLRKQIHAHKIPVDDREGKLHGITTCLDLEVVYRRTRACTKIGERVVQ